MPINFNLLKTLSGHGYDVNTVAFTRDSARLASGGGDRSVRIWDVAEQRQVLSMEHGEWVNDVAFAPTGKFLASGARNGSVKLWSAENGALLGTIQAHPQNASSVAFSPDGMRLVSGGGEGAIRIVNLRDKKIERSIDAHVGWVWRVGFSSLGDRLVSAGGDRVARIWRVDGGDDPVALAGNRDDVLYAAFSPDDRFVATACKDGVARLWLADTGQELFAFAAHEGACNSITFSPDGKHLVTAGADKAVRVWLVESGELARELTGHQDYVATAVFAPDGKTMASCGGDGTVKIWEAAERAAYGDGGGSAAGLEIEHQDATPRGATAYVSAYAAGKVLGEATLKSGVRLSLLRATRDRITLGVGQPPRTAVSVSDSDLTVHSAEGVPLFTLDLASLAVTYDRTEGAAAPWAAARDEGAALSVDPNLERAADSPAPGRVAPPDELEIERSESPASRRYQSFSRHGEMLASERTNSGHTIWLVRFDADTLYLVVDERDEPTVVARGEVLDVRDASGKPVFRTHLRTLEPVLSRRGAAGEDGGAAESEAAAGAVGPTEPEPARDPLLVHGLSEMEAGAAEPRLHRLLAKAVWGKASDIHVPSGAPVQIRRHGRLQPASERTYRPDEIESMLLEILTPEQRRRFEETNDLDFSYEIPGVGRFRANVCRQHRGVDGTFRVIPDTIPSFEALGLPASVLPMTKHHQGLVLVTGPAGQGKSTTIATLVDLINSDKPHHIITVEDPIEFVHPIKRAVVNQREVGRHTLSFANALRAALREDPDVIVVGEMRDLETISLAITASETGHLVFGSLMTTSASQTIDRILDSFPAGQQAQIRTMLSESLKGIVSQQLVPTVDGEGRALACEVLVGTPAVANMIRERKTFQLPSVMQTGRNLGMQRMDDALYDLVAAGRVSDESAVMYAQDPKGLETRFRPKAPAEQQAAPGYRPR